ncbi:MAG: sulfotransferase domain-containing protein [Chloroflexota bacterium]|nr:sulfotransferase domain-containing protein [Chloroflexota bacterium]
MRILIAGPAKAGNVWTKCMIANCYQLRPLDGAEIPDGAKLDDLKRWLDAGRFPDQTIFHQHFPYSLALVTLVEAVPAHLVTVVRDPYDAFVSSYFAIQSGAGRAHAGPRRTDAILNKPLDSPEVYAYLQTGGFRQHLVRAHDYIQSGRSTILRYENLHRDPVAELTRLTEVIGPVAEERLTRSIDACSADNMRKAGGQTAGHVRTAKVGDSRERLTEHHLAIFRELHADLIREMGYQVR